MITTCGSNRANSSKPCHFFHGHSGLHPGCRAMVPGARLKCRCEAIAKGAGKGPSHPTALAMSAPQALSPFCSHCDCSKTKVRCARTKRCKGKLHMVNVATS